MKKPNFMFIKSEKTFLLIFLIIVLAELICDTIESLALLHYITKPLILISLILFFWKHCKHLEKKTRLFTFSALILSLFGDVFLMFVNKSSIFFIVGLLSFLLAHNMYVFVFIQKRNNSNNTLPFIAVLLVYAFGLFYFLKNGLGDLLIPVIVYMFAILLMATSAFLRRGSVSKNSYILVFIGALFFMISDSLLALNKFHAAFPFSGISIMLTYSMAQLLIVFGIKRQN